MKREFKKAASLLMAASMLTGVMSVTASAATYETWSDVSQLSDAETTVVLGASATSVETYPDAIVQVIVPTQEKVNEVFEMKLDPLHLFAEVADEAFDGASVDENANILFKNYDEDGATLAGLSGTSDALTITNRGTAELDVYVKIEATNPNPTTNFKYVDSPVFADTAKSVYMGAIVENDGKATNDGNAIPLIEMDGTKVKSQTITAKRIMLKGDDMYKLAYNTSDKVFSWTSGDSYSDDADGWPTFGFKLTGMLNPGADWTDPTLDLSGVGGINIAQTWSIKNYKPSSYVISGKSGSTQKLEIPCGDAKVGDTFTLWMVAVPGTQNGQKMENVTTEVCKCTVNEFGNIVIPGAAAEMLATGSLKDRCGAGSYRIQASSSAHSYAFSVTEK